MGCKASQIKGDGAPNAEASASLPAVPDGSWYAKQFMEPTSMQMSEFHFRNKGKALFSSRLLPASRQNFEANPNAEVSVSKRFTLGEELIYGMCFFHNTALFIEHHWRTRVAFEPKIERRFERPFYNMFIGIKVMIDGQLVEDLTPFDGALPSCTATIRAPEATTTWLCCPVVLHGDPEHRILSRVHLYRGLMLSFLSAARALSVGEHAVTVHAVYGCTAENNFCTDFIAVGEFALAVTADSAAKVSPAIAKLQDMVADRYPTHIPFENNAKCVYCSEPKRFLCTVCGAAVCGSPQCVWSVVGGYPCGCRSHKAMIDDD